MINSSVVVRSRPLREDDGTRQAESRLVKALARRERISGYAVVSGSVLRFA